MLIDLRFYTLYPGRLSAFLEMFEGEGLSLQCRHCGDLLMYATTLSGPVNCVVQAWRYDNSADRDTRRSALWADAEWCAFGRQALPLIQHQEIQLLRSTGLTSPRAPFVGAAVVDLRSYTFRPGGLADYLPLCASEGFARQRQHCGHALFHAASETGVLNQVVQAWAYRSLDDYQERQARLFADSIWAAAYRPKALRIAVRQEHQFLRLTRFSPTVKSA